MNKAVTTVLVTGATIAGVAGVLVLNPTAPSLNVSADADERSALAEQDQGVSAPGDTEDLSEFAGDEDGRVPHGTRPGPRGGFAPPGFPDQDDDLAEQDDLTGQDEDEEQSTQAAGTRYTGSSYQSPWGAMQVSITVSNGRIADIQWEQIPQSDGHSYRINKYAAPLLVEQALEAQSATVDSVSGATYTTEGFRTSLQSAIEKAGL